MSHNHDVQRTARFAPLINGVLIGQAIWALCLAAAYAGRLPLFGMFAAPIAAFGYFLIWGDNGPPEWAQSIAVHAVFGLFFYGVIGALVGSRIGLQLRFSLRILLVGTTVVAAILGVASALRGS